MTCVHFQQENQSKKDDNRLPDKAPKLHKHGKVNDITLTSGHPVRCDFPFPTLG